MLFLKVYLFAGLVLHKLIWEFLRTRGTVQKRDPMTFFLIAVKSLKMALLLGILIQVWLTDIWPISRDPFILRVIGTAIFTFGLSIAIAARIQLSGNWSNIETGKVLSNQSVVDCGVYNYIRHPIYTGDLLLLFGLELALNSWLLLGVLVLAPIVFIKALGEERMLLGTLNGYDSYYRRTKRFIPFVV